MPLAFAQTGIPVKVNRVGGAPKVRQFLENLGITIGSMVTVISITTSGLIINVRETRVAISKEMANKIMIQVGGSTMLTLKEIKTGSTVSVVKLHGEGAVKRRIMDMGITKGTSVQVRKVAPLGDPIEVTVRGYELSLRKADAEMIEVQ